MLELRNPHSILAALEKRPAAVRSIRMNSHRPPAIWESVARKAAQCGVTMTMGRAEDKLAGRPRRDTERQGAGSAQVEPPSPVPIGNVFRRSSADKSFGIWMALEQIQDPQNLGALFRLAGFFGVIGIILTKDQTSPVNATVCDIAAGGTEHIPFTVVANLTNAFQKAQEANVWVLGTSERASESIREVKHDRNWMLVMGNEAQGLRRLTRERCDSLCALPAIGPVASLNVATAASACLTLLTSAK